MITPPRLERFAFSPTLPLKGRVKEEATPSRFRDPEGPEAWERCGPNSGRAHAGGPSLQRQPARALGERSVTQEVPANALSARTSRARCFVAGTLTRSRCLPQPSTALTCRFSRQRAGSIRKAPLTAPPPVCERALEPPPNSRRARPVTATRMSHRDIATRHRGSVSLRSPTLGSQGLARPSGDRVRPT